MNEELSHIDKAGNPNMVDVSAKTPGKRTAVARCKVRFPEDVWLVLEKDQFSGKKGPVIQTAIIAGIMGAKNTAQLIPLCHPLGLDDVNIEIVPNQDNSLVITCSASCFGKTGVEMEAMTGCSVAALTIYDMCKALSHDIRIEKLELISKTGGKRDFNRNE